MKKLTQEDRKSLRNIGVKFGRYHIFLFKLFKPKQVSLRVLLWKNFKQINLLLKPPTFGLNFTDNSKFQNKDFMLLCGFEKFDRFFVRIDILERLFIHIIKNNLENNQEVKLVPEMLNLLGCNKENFVKLIKNMNYKPFERNNETYFKYNPRKINYRQKNKFNSDNPFNVLNQINFE